MGTVGVLQPLSKKRKSNVNKIPKFLGAWLLADITVFGALMTFIDNLNQKGILGLGADFRSTYLFWGDGIGLNLLKVVGILSCSYVFGVIFGYLSRNLTISEKIVSSTINAVLATFGYMIILTSILVLFPAGREEAHRIVAWALSYAVSTPSHVVYLALQLLCGFVGGYYGSGLGIRIVNAPNHTLDKEKSGTFLGIRWFHYIWLSVPIGLYLQVFFNLLYATGYTLVKMIRNLSWLDFLGVTTSKKGNNFDVAWSSLFGIWIGCVISVCAIMYLWSLLSGEKKAHWFLKVLMSIIMGFVVPFAILCIAELLS